LVEPAGPQGATRILRLTIANRASRSSNDDPKLGVEVAEKRGFGYFDHPIAQNVSELAENPTFQALSSELRMTEFQVILRTSQVAKCISLKADIDQEKVNRANSFM
jgi:hypothetical protein